MFHVMLVLPVLAGMVAFYGVLAAVILGLPFWVGLGLQLILTAVTGKRVLLALPAVLGAVCAVGYLFWLGELLPLWFFFIYWAVFYICLWVVWLLTDKVRRLVLKWLGGR